MTKRTWVFSYGSNSSTQLRARVNNPTLTCEPAFVDDYSRIFCLSSCNWSVNEIPSGAASLVEEKGRRTLGCAALMTDDELGLLDVFEGVDSENPSEGVYRRVAVCINICPRAQRGQTSQKENGLMYLANNTAWQFPPSEQYLTAIHVMLRHHELIDVDESKSIEEGRSIRNSAIFVRGVMPGGQGGATDLFTWRHPGTPSLSLPSLCVEVNSLRTTPWVMPQMLKEIVRKLGCVGINSSAQLAVHLPTAEMRTCLNGLLEKAGEGAIEDTTLCLFKQVLCL